MKRTILVCTALLGAISLKAQSPNANPYVLGINAAASPIEVGESTTTTFDLGNNGSDPIPAGGATFNVSFPPNVTVDQASLDLDGGAGIFTPTWTVIAGTGTFLQLDVSGTGIPAFTFGGPQTLFHMTVQITGATAGGPALQQTINALPNPAIAQNANAGDDNAFGPIQVVPSSALPITLISFAGKLIGQATARLDWQVAAPDHFSHFELERSTDGRTFSKVATIKLATQDKYQHDDDIKGLHDNVLYRLRMVDLGGTSGLSQVVYLKPGKAGDVLSVYPNPAVDKILVKGITADARYTVHTADGRLMKAGAISATDPGIDISGLAAGTLFVKISIGARAETVTVIKK